MTKSVGEKKFQREIITSGKRRAIPITTVISAEVKIKLQVFDADDVMDQLSDMFAVQHKLIAGGKLSESHYKLSANNVPDLDRALNWLEERDILG